MTTHAHLELRGAIEPGFEEILTPDALEFLAALQHRFGPPRRSCSRRAHSAERGWRPGRCSTSCPRRARSARATGRSRRRRRT